MAELNPNWIALQNEVGTEAGIEGATKTVDPNTLATTRALQVLLPQYYDAANLKDYITCLVKPFEVLQAAHSGLRHLRTLDKATGINLDIIGKLVGMPRLASEDPLIYYGWRYLINSEGFGTTSDAGQGAPFMSTADTQKGNPMTPLDDNTYRNFIKAKILLNVSYLSREDIIQIIEYLIPSATEFEVIENLEGAASYHVNFTNNIDNRDKILISRGFLFKPAGVSVTYSDPEGIIVTEE